MNAVYQQLHRYDATWRHFLPRQYGYHRPVANSLEELTDDHPMIAYLDMVGKLHTAKAGTAALGVSFVQMNAQLGFVADALASTFLGLALQREQEARTLQTFNKLLWLQSDLINRHYQEAALPCPVA